MISSAINVMERESRDGWMRGWNVDVDEMSRPGARARGEDRQVNILFLSQEGAREGILVGTLRRERPLELYCSCPSTAN
jgi:hypothetical protein